MNTQQLRQLIGLGDDTSIVTYRCPAALYAEIERLNARYGLDNSKTTRLLVALGLECAAQYLEPLLDQLIGPPDAA